MIISTHSKSLKQVVTWLWNCAVCAVQILGYDKKILRHSMTTNEKRFTSFLRLVELRYPIDQSKALCRIT